jgi:hypothetical protein
LLSAEGANLMTNGCLIQPAWNTYKLRNERCNVFYRRRHYR